MKYFAATWPLLITLAIVPFACVAPIATAPQADKEAVVKANNAFAMELYGQLSKRMGNLILSPYSISTALAMTYAGAGGQTAAEMAKTLHFSLDQKHLHAALAAVNHDITAGGRTRDYQLYTANALWGQKGHSFFPNFLELVQWHYAAAIKQVDFQNATEDARREINTWVEKQTQDKIKDLLQPGIVDSATRLVLTNAIYFKGNWASKFMKEHTRTEDFNVTAEQKVPAAMMHQTDKFKYLDEKELQVLEMPYAGDTLAMVVLLPRKIDGLSEIERTLTPESLAHSLAKLHRVEVHVALPKCQFVAESQLQDALSQMGMPLAFRPGEADFSGMDGKRDLFLSAVVHKAFVDVNEEGTEAAAATGAVAGLAAAPVQRLVFRADHPFLFLIRDTRSGGILFMGRLTRPMK
jgi:serpin B